MIHKNKDMNETIIITLLALSNLASWVVVAYYMLKEIREKKLNEIL